MLPSGFNNTRGGVNWVFKNFRKVYFNDANYLKSMDLQRIMTKINELFDTESIRQEFTTLKTSS